MRCFSVKKKKTGAGWLIRKIPPFVLLLFLPLILMGGECSVFKPQRNVILITIDTLRADRLSCYGSETVDTPNIDALAERGVLFEETITPVPLTLPGHASILTGLYPEEHGIRNNGFFRLSGEAVTLAEVFKGEGYDTAAFISSSIMNAQFGLDQGFDTYKDLSFDSRANREFSLVISADAVTRKVLSWVNKNPEGPFFLWIHYFDPHSEYKPPEPYRSMYEHPYDGEVAFVDSRIGVLMEEFEKRGLLENTLTVVTSDHGEGLGEHGERFHGFFLYDTTMTVPLIFSGADIPPGKRIGSMVSLLDIAPTIMSYLGMDGKMETSGRDLLGSMTRDETIEKRPVYIETMAPAEMMAWSGLTGLRTAEYKLVSEPATELYDLESDPSEMNNIYADSEKIVRKLSKRMSRIREGFSRISTRGSSEFSPDEDTRRNLEALGYAGGKAEKKSNAENPADMKEVLHYYYRARDLVKQGLPSLAISAYTRAEELDPDNPVVLDELAYLLMRNDKFEASERKFKKLLDLFPERARSWKNFGRLYLKMGKFDKVEKYARKALQLEPGTIEAHFMLGVAAQKRGDGREAVEHYKKELTINPNHRESIKNLGEILVSSPETREIGKKLLQKARSMEKGKRASGEPPGLAR